MSSYENYTETSKNYDKTRVPIGLEIILGCYARGPKALAEQVVLDAGCGTGSYSKVLSPHVARIEAVDLNPGMLSVAGEKLKEAHAAGKVAFHRSRIDALPFAEATFDGIMINQVLHHLPDNSSYGYPLYKKVIHEFARVLKPGGGLIVNICSHAQLRRGWWYGALIPDAVEGMCDRHIPLDELTRLLTESDFTYRGRYVPVDGLFQGTEYFSARGPLDKHWRDGDSIWATVPDDQRARVLSRVRKMDEAGELETFVRNNDVRRPEIGQVTFLFASKV